MKKILIVYATQQGQTKKIAEAIALELEKMNFAVYAGDVSQIEEQNHVESYDAVLVGGSIHAGGYSRIMKKWLKKKAVVLNQKPTAFYSVCLGILQKEEKVQKEVHQFPEDLFSATAWRPRMWTIFAGALPYTKYNWVTRFIMKRIVSKASGDTDTSRDYEYTNWSEVKKFARQFGSMVDLALIPRATTARTERESSGSVPRART